MPSVDADAAAVTEAERLVPLRVAAAALGIGHKTLQNRVCLGACPELQAVKVFGRWKVRVSVIQQIQQQGTGSSDRVAALINRLDYPRLRLRESGGPARAKRGRGPGSNPSHVPAPRRASPSRLLRASGGPAASSSTS